MLQIELSMKNIWEYITVPSAGTAQNWLFWTKTQNIFSKIDIMWRCNDNSEM